MSKPRFQITAAVVLVLILAGLVFLVKRPDSHPSHAIAPVKQIPDAAIGTAPKALHIEGCDKEIPLNANEDVEPRVIPETTLSKLREVYGKESKREERYDSYIWSKSNFELTVYDPGATQAFHSLSLDVVPGREVTTPDSIVLGQDTYATALQKTKAHGIAAHQGLSKNGDYWVLTLWFPSQCNTSFLSEYKWNLASDPKVDRQIEPSSEAPHGQTPERYAGLFRDRLVTSYHFESPNQFNADEAGPPPADH